MPPLSTSRTDPSLIRIGQDGFLFLVGGRNRPLEAYRPSLQRWNRLRRWENLIRTRKQRAEALGLRYLHVIVPEKLTVYPEKVTDLALDPAGSVQHILAGRFAGDPAFVDLLPDLLSAKAAADIYRRTDTHWTFAGCLVAHDAVCRALGITPAADLAARPWYESEQAGDLGVQLVPERTETVRHYGVQIEAQRTFANDLVLHHEALDRRQDLHRGAHVVFRNENPAAAPKTVVLFGDSYSHYVPFLLTGMLAETFRELHFVWSAAIDWAYVERVRPDVLVGEIAERFMRKVPRDDFDVAAFGAERLAALR